MDGVPSGRRDGVPSGPHYIILGLRVTRYIDL